MRIRAREHLSRERQPLLEDDLVADPVIAHVEEAADAEFLDELARAAVARGVGEWRPPDRGVP